jgi:hypothetical protein
MKTKGNRLRSPRPPSLPFPLDPDRGLVNSPRPLEDVFRGRLVKQPMLLVCAFLDLPARCHSLFHLLGLG